MEGKQAFLQFPKGGILVILHSLKPFQTPIILEGPRVRSRRRKVLQTRIAEGVRIGNPKLLKRFLQQLFQLDTEQRPALAIHPKRRALGVGR
mgnify:FL=1